MYSDSVSILTRSSKMESWNVLLFLTQKSTTVNSRCSNTNRFISSVCNKCPVFYRKDLKAHYGCVNAIEFSRDDRLLASGGDDKRVLVWDVGKALSASYTSKIPVKMKAEHNSNVFSISFNATNQVLLSGGNDGCVIVHDVISGDHKDTYICDEAVYSITSDPTNEPIFIASNHQGKANLYDTRCSEESLTFGESAQPMYTVQYNPAIPQYVASINAKSSALLWDVRNLKQPAISYRYSATTYNGMSLSFNQTGDKLFVIGRRMPTLLYDSLNEKPLHEFNSDGYYCACTIKSCCWAGSRHEYVVMGSDNFGVYMWRVPEEATPDNYVVKVAERVLRGHRSIVNQVRYNNAYAVLASSGVEKTVKLWSPFNISQEKESPEQEHNSQPTGDASERYIYTHQEYIQLMMNSGNVMSHNYEDECMEEDPIMMAFFDSIIQKELQVLSSDDSDDSEEACQRLYDYELSSRSSSSSSSSSDSSSSTHNYTSRRRRRLAASDSSSDDFRSNEGHADGQDGSMVPRSTVTMSDLIAKRKQQDLDRALAAAKRKLRRQKRREEMSKAKNREDSTDDDSVDTSRLSNKERRKYLQKKRGKRVLRRLALDDIKKYQEEDQGRTTLAEEISQNLRLPNVNTESSDQLGHILSLKRSVEDDDKDETCFKDEKKDTENNADIKRLKVNWGASTSSSSASSSNNNTNNEVKDPPKVKFKKPAKHRQQQNYRKQSTDED